MTVTTDRAVRTALAGVEDPEVPISLADLGVLRNVDVTADRVLVTLVPTRLGCPGRHEMERRVRRAVKGVAPQLHVDVEWKLSSWDDRDISTRGRVVLEAAGYVAGEAAASECPYCQSRHVERTAAFGGSLCKSPFACRSCGSTFDALRGTGLPVHP